jgi:hypothetical protein
VAAAIAAACSTSPARRAGAAELTADRHPAIRERLNQSN